MQKKKITVLLLLIVVVLLLSVLIKGRKDNVAPKSNKSGVQQTVVSSKTETGKYETQVNREEGIEVSVEPKTLLEGKESVFSVTMNNHVIDLDYDFAKISTITDDSGKVYEASEWKGPKGGHHVEGSLIFPVIAGEVKSLELKIAGIAGEDRVFKWEIK